MPVTAERQQGKSDSRDDGWFPAAAQLYYASDVCLFEALVTRHHAGANHTAVFAKIGKH